MASYATTAQLVERVDWRDVADLVSDDGTAIAEGAIATDAKVLTALADASGDIEAALVVANRYTVADLEGLTGNSANQLQRVTTDLAMFYLYDRRRSSRGSDTLEYFEGLREKHLRRLRKGENVFNLTAQKAAGLPTVSGLSTQEYDKQNLIVTRCRGAFFPRAHLPDNR